MLLDHEPCDCGAEGVAPASPVGWDALMAATFPVEPPSRRPSTRRRWPWRDPVARLEPAPPPLVVVVGAAWPALPEARARGVLRARSPLRAPFSGRPCAAWAVFIVHGEQVLLRDARVADATLELSGGVRAEIAAGRARIAAPRARAAVFPMQVADEYLVGRRMHPPPALGAADPRGAAHPFAGDAGLELSIEDGQRVGVASELATRLDEDAPASYRDGPRARLALEGAPTFVLGSLARTGASR